MSSAVLFLFALIVVVSAQNDLQVANLTNDKDCLSPKQMANLEISIAAIQSTLQISLAGLSISMIYATPENQAIIAKAIPVMQAINNKLVSQLEDIVTSACPTCTSIIAVIQKSMNAIKSTMIEIDPTWATDPNFMGITIMLDTIAVVASNVCKQVAPGL